MESIRKGVSERVLVKLRAEKCLRFYIDVNIWSAICKLGVLISEFDALYRHRVGVQYQIFAKRFFGQNLRGFYKYLNSWDQIIEPLDQKFWTLDQILRAPACETSLSPDAAHKIASNYISRHSDHLRTGKIEFRRDLAQIPHRNFHIPDHQIHSIPLWQLPRICANRCHLQNLS